MKSENNILLVVNPVAGDCDKNPLIDLVKKEADARKFTLRIFNTTGHDDKQKIKQKIKRYHPQRIIVAGGDGTISLVAQTILNSDCILGIIPAGSANGLAINFDLPTDEASQVSLALQDCIIKMDTLEINGKICLHIADLGINAELIKNYENSGVRGKWGYFLQTIPTLIQTDSPFDFEIEINKKTLNPSGILLAVANAKKFGTGANINPQGDMCDGKFEILVFKNLDFIEIFKTISENPILDPAFVDVISTNNAIIKCKNTVPFQIDGEYLGEMDFLKVSINPHSLRIAVPQAFCDRHSRN